MRAPDESTSAEPLGTPILRAEDGELRGSVARREDGRWVAQAVFGGVIGIGDTAGEARALVERDGLASLSWRWFYRPRPGADWEVVVIQEAWPGRAVVVEGAYALAGMPTYFSTASPASSSDTSIQRTALPSPDMPVYYRSLISKKSREVDSPEGQSGVAAKGSRAGKRRSPARPRAMTTKYALDARIPRFPPSAPYGPSA